MPKKRFFTGIKPTGSPHIGTYIGVIANALNYANTKEYECFFGVVDLHSITVEWDPKELLEHSEEVITFYLASGFDPEYCNFFFQSHNFDHPYLAWILNCIASMGRIGDMIEYKEKALKQGGYASVGLFDYPVLMAADILLYNSNIVPVGEDQMQHIELARDLGQKFNVMFGETFTLPEGKIMPHGNRIMSLQHPEKKMSKSDKDNSGCIFLIDKPEEGAKKVMKAVTDSENKIRFDEKNKPGISNLMVIYSILANKSLKEIEMDYANKSYGDFKKDLAEIVKTFLEEFQKKYNHYISNPDEIKKILQKGIERSRAITGPKLDEVRRKVGFVL